MAILRFLLMAFNVAVFTYLIYHLLWIARQPIERQKKIIIIVCGIVLLLAPVAMIIGAIPASPIYFLAYPAAISLLIFLTKQT